MEWTLQRTADGSSAPDSIAFDPSDVYRLSQLGRNLPWLAALDPYRDREIIGDELRLARQDIEAALARHCIDFFAGDASSYQLTAGQLRLRQDLVDGLVRKLASDPTYRLLLRMIAVLHDAEVRQLTIQVYGT